MIYLKKTLQTACFFLLQKIFSFKDDELTSAQLRARHGIPNNPQEFSTSHDKNAGGVPLVAVLVVAVLVLGVGAYFAFFK